MQSNNPPASGRSAPRPGRRLTTEEFIRRARSVFGDKYDYSQTVYTTRREKVTVTCREHGPFEVYPMNHLRGVGGCPKCRIRFSDLASFIAEAKRRYGDKYTYEKALYVNSHTPLTVTCPVHGDFSVTPGNFLLDGIDCGCPKCRREASRTTKDEFITRAIKVHGQKYDYSKAVFTRLDDVVTIICPVHGEFRQKASNHLMGQGCPGCAREGKMLSTEEWISRAGSVHGDRFDYSGSVYTGTRRAVTVVCREHGEFRVIPNTHLRLLSGGCPVCKKTQCGATTEGFIAKARTVHGDKYDYSKVNYSKNDVKVAIICPRHGAFLQTPSDHLAGKGCPGCANEKRVAANTTIDQTEFVRRTQAACGPMLDLSGAVYSGYYNDVTVRCLKHGTFSKSAQLLMLGHGCPKCTLENRRMLHRLVENGEFLLSAPQGVLVEILSAGALPASFRELIFTEENTVGRENALRRLRSAIEEKPFGNEDEARLSDSADAGEMLLPSAQAQFIEDDSTDASGLSSLRFGKDSPTALDILGLLSARSLGMTSRDGLSAFLREEFSRMCWRDLIDGRVTREQILAPSGDKLAEEFLSSFRMEMTAVEAVFTDGDCRFPHRLTLLQKLIVHRLCTRRSYANWSGMGTGKTLAALVAARRTRSRVTLVLAPKDVIAQSWIPQTREAYPDTLILTDTDAVPGDGDIRRFDDLGDGIPVEENGYNLVLVNYDRFSDADKAAALLSLLEGIRPDMVCLDEVQYIKVRDEAEASARHLAVSGLIRRLRETNPDVRIHLMSGTPVINNLLEPYSLTGILTGKDMSEKDIRVTVKNVHDAYREVTMNGFRYTPPVRSGNVRTVLPKIDGSALLDGITALPKDGGVLPLERLLTLHKMESPEVVGALRSGTIIYTHYIDGITGPVLEKVRSAGLSAEAYTGDTPDRERVFGDFVSGRTDVLVCSRPVILGVDGLQNRSDNIIVLSLPWTWSEYSQLVARLNRPRKTGSPLGENPVMVTIPQVNIPLPGGTWSWDRRRLALIREKKTLGEAVTDGYVEKLYTVDKKKYLVQAVEALKRLTESQPE